jgi:hypothetical protein
MVLHSAQWGWHQYEWCPSFSTETGKHMDLMNNKLSHQTTMRYLLIPARMAIIKMITNAVKDVEKGELS